MTKNTSIAWVIGALIVGAVGGYFVANSSSSSTAGNDSVKTSAPVNTATAGTDEWKIQNALSAAPSTISKDATVLDWPVKEGDTFRKLRTGTNSWTCIPDLPTSPGNDPLCADETAMQWFSAYMSQKTPKIAQTGIAYMLQGGSDPSNTDPFATEPKAGESWMAAPPHIMIFSPSKLDTKVYGTDPIAGGPWIMWAGTPYEHLMIPAQL